MTLNVHGIEFKYTSLPTLKDVSFGLNGGEFMAILGNNGAGKSTLLKCINRILKPRKGVVYLGEDRVSALTRMQVAQRIGYVAQRNEAGRFTVFDAVLLGRKPYIKWDVGQEDIEIVDDVLKRMGLNHLVLRYLDELSGGELQKVVIARALVQEPDVMLLDEPTNNLDLKNQIEVLKIVKETVADRGIAAVVVMHDINLALRFADKFLLLKDGIVHGCGGLEVITEENIEEVYGLPVRMEKINDLPVVVPV
ncbi:putative ABC transporter ATP-binding protein MJ0089 [Acetivibrio thermocellus BC1]|nr:putative ABC transporter ATP-binding protein MJ0089 [Acetivibrio thermocellus BC1]